MDRTIPYQYAREKELFLLIAQGDEPAFEALFRLYVPKIEPVIFQIVKSEAAVKDIVQDIFLNLWIRREKLVEIESPANWIFKIVYNRCYGWLETMSIRKTASLDSSGEDSVVTSANSTEEQVLFAETSRLVKQAIQELPAQTRKIYRLSREEGLKHSDIADELGISVQTVKNTLSNAGRSIRDYLTQHGISLPLILVSYWML